VYPNARYQCQVFIFGVFLASAVRFAMMLMMEQSSPTNSVTSLSLHL
jgi:hypothetical protein